MIRWFRIVLCALLLSAPTAPAMAVQPDEVLADPVLEQRAREISRGLRCIVCQNESIDESNASLARDLRLLVRERLVAGDTNQEAVDFIVTRYGEFVLLQPRITGANVVLWAAGPALFVFAMLIAALYLHGRSRARPAAEATLTRAEQKRLDELMKD